MKRRLVTIGCALGLSALSSGCWSSDDRFSVLTYNVQALPGTLAEHDPQTTLPIISPKLNEYDLVLIQENFFYWNQLASKTHHRYVSSPQQGKAFRANDGLTRFSYLPFGVADHTRVEWVTCNGFLTDDNDCLAMKGFSVATHLLYYNLGVDVYNIHMDAGSSSGDRLARAQQISQLVQYINTRSATRAVIVAGDTNLTGSDKDLLENLLTGAGLTDSCRALDCGDESRIDRVMYRSSADIELVPLKWKIPTEFVDEKGEALSDHVPVMVEFQFRLPSYYVFDKFDASIL
ncbi:endonuclease/exonuclease/phosphatase family protein [Candidatus Woesearchaeota archaeon]|nr:endonuclease/exonuclease/phosphatase family protein [Candidatus Woesearchaeota archaeon]